MYGPNADDDVASAQEPTEEEIRAYVKAQWTPVLVRRARATSLILILGTFGFSLSALYVLPREELGIIRFHLVHAALQIANYVLLARIANENGLRWLPAIAAAATTIVVAWGATQVGHTITTALLVGGYLMGAGALMPWGFPRQIFVTAIGFAAFVANVHGVTGGWFLSAGYYVSIPVLMMAGTALYTAYEFDRSRHETAREELRRVYAERALIAANATLEMHVEERTRELRRAMEELRAFSYTVSHDLRAPLRAINGFSHTLADEFGHSLGPRGLEILNRVRAATKRMGDMIDAMLALGRVTSSEIRRSRVNLGLLASSVASELDRSEPSRRVDWRIPPVLFADGDSILLHMLVENLLANSHKFTRTVDHPRVELGSRNVGSELVYYVRDNGVGFDMDHAHQLFDPFQRLHNDERFEGSGVGLATVNRIIERHGGRIWAEAEPGNGATFFFTLGPPAPTAAAVA